MENTEKCTNILRVHKIIKNFHKLMQVIIYHSINYQIKKPIINSENDWQFASQLNSVIVPQNLSIIR